MFHLSGPAAVKLTIFVIASAGIILISRVSLRVSHSHGFFRFFAFESIMALMLLNTEYWFAEPFSAVHIISWILLLCSLFLAVHGFYLLREIGKPRHGRGNNATNLGFENTTTLVISGAYKYIRHPLYCSLLLLGWGAFLKRPTILSVFLILATSAFLFATAKVEEKENLRRFGIDYAEYMKRTKMFIPFLF
jgi:protein-S-isoprenylcysteine O-methyltransferase Ste14